MFLQEHFDHNYDFAFAMQTEEMFLQEHSRQSCDQAYQATNQNVRSVPAGTFGRKGKTQTHRSVIEKFSRLFR